MCVLVASRTMQCLSPNRLRRHCDRELCLRDGLGAVTRLSVPFLFAIVGLSVLTFPGKGNLAQTAAKSDLFILAHGVNHSLANSFLEVGVFFPQIFGWALGKVIVDHGQAPQYFADPARKSSASRAFSRGC